MLNIRTITIGRCLDYQCSSEYAAWKARETVIRGDHVLAIAYQAAAARDHENMRTRLDRILGVGAIVEQRY